MNKYFLRAPQVISHAAQAENQYLGAPCCRIWPQGMCVKVPSAADRSTRWPTRVPFLQFAATSAKYCPFPWHHPLSLALLLPTMPADVPASFRCLNCASPVQQEVEPGFKLLTLTRSAVVSTKGKTSTMKIKGVLNQVCFQSVRTLGTCYMWRERNTNYSDNSPILTLYLKRMPHYPGFS